MRVNIFLNNLWKYYDLMDFAQILTIISVAFLSSISHCVGMCGGFLSLQSLFLKDKKATSAATLSFFYHIFRILAYILIGAVCGAFGGIIALSSNSRAVLFFIVGIVLIVIGVALWIRGELLKFIENDKFSKFITSLALKISKKSSILNFLALGFLNGFLPCGVVYYFAAMAITSQSALLGASIMAVFGLSTLPIMIIFLTLFKFIGDKFKQIMFKISLIIIIANGIYLAFLGYMANG
ncbi:sulfite exporter TauE/SafE family protein [Campylobacter anatolicus]|nr:sulfite exporter TauE/SafE family protein [Campylobacter anatolicus]